LSVTPNIPEKPFFRVNEVCQLTDTQPYVLRFWESEFPQLSPDHGHGGKPVYKKGDVELILQIKHLLYEEEYTLAGARQVLSGAAPAGLKPAKVKVSAKKRAQADESDSRQLNLEAAVPEHAAPVYSEPTHLEVQGISKERYDDAVEEITHLRLHLSEAETRLRRADSERDKAMNEAEQLRDKRERIIGRLEAILHRVQDDAS